MGLAVRPVYSKKVTDADSFTKYTDGKDLGYRMDLLDQICSEKGVTAISTFAPDFEALAEELAPGETLEELWFDSTDGLRTMATLIRALQTEKKWAKGIRKYEMDGLVRSLQELEKDLKVAKKNKARFYLLVC